MRVLMVPARRSRKQNPLPWLLTRALEASEHRVDDFDVGKVLTQRYDAALFHWPEHFAAEPETYSRAVGRTAALLTTVGLLRRRGARVYWFAHDVEPLRPTRPKLSRALMHAFTRNVDGVFCLSKITEREVGSRYRMLVERTRVVPHGLLGQVYGHTPPAWAEEFERFRRGRAVYGFLGDIKQYKGVETVAGLVAQQTEDSVFLVVGKVDRAISSLPKELAGASDSVFSRFERIEDETMGWMLRQCTALLLPYSWGWNTGLGHLALEYGVPVIGSSVPAITGLAEEYPGAPVYSCDALADYRRAMLAVRAGTSETGWQREFLSRNEWQGIGRTLSLSMQ